MFEFFRADRQWPKDKTTIFIMPNYQKPALVKLQQLQLGKIEPPSVVDFHTKIN
jgi:hypothetical protein